MVKPSRSSLIGIVLVVGFLAASWSSGDKPLKAVQGSFDLQGLPTGSVAELAGEWEYYPGELLTPSDFARDPHPQAERVLSLPGPWTKAKGEGGSPDNRGVATFRLSVRHPWVGRAVGLKIKKISEAYELFADGVLVARAGVVSAVPGEFRGRYAPQTVFVTPQTDTLSLVLRVANLDAGVAGGPLEAILIGDRSAIEKEASLLFATDAFALGGRVLFVLLFVGLYFLARSGTALAFAVYNLLVVIQSSLTRELLALKFFPDIDAGIVARLFSTCQVVLAPALLVTALAYLGARSPHIRLPADRLVARLLIGGGALVVAAILVIGPGALWRTPLGFGSALGLLVATYGWTLWILGAQSRGTGSDRAFFWVWTLFLVNGLFIALGQFQVLPKDYLYPLSFLRSVPAAAAVADFRIPQMAVSYALGLVLAGFLVAKIAGPAFRQRPQESPAPPATDPVAAFVRQHKISPREEEVLRLAITGLSYEDIASRTFVSFHTVKAHLRSIYRKVGVNNKTELAARLRD